MADRNANMCVGHGLRELVGFPLLQGAPMLRDYRVKCTGMRFSMGIFWKLLRAFLSRKTHSGSRQVDSFSPVLLVSERAVRKISDSGYRSQDCVFGSKTRKWGHNQTALSPDLFLKRQNTELLVHPTITVIAPTWMSFLVPGFVMTMPRCFQLLKEK